MVHTRTGSLVPYRKIEKLGAKSIEGARGHDNGELKEWSYRVSVVQFG